MSLPAHLALRLLIVTLLCLAGAVAWTLWDARGALRVEAAVSAERIAAALARQPGLGSVGPAALPVGEPQAEPAVLMLLPGICAEIRLGSEVPRRLCGDWDGLGTAPARLASVLSATALGWLAAAGLVAPAGRIVRQDAPAGPPAAETRSL